MQSDGMSVVATDQQIILTHMSYEVHPSHLPFWGVISVLVLKLLSHSNSGWIQANG